MLLVWVNGYFCRTPNKLDIIILTVNPFTTMLTMRTNFVKIDEFQETTRTRRGKSKHNIFYRQ